MRTDLRGNARGVNVFLADGTVSPGHFLHAFMGILEVVGQTHVALVAVEILVTASNLHNISYYKTIQW